MFDLRMVEHASDLDLVVDDLRWKIMIIVPGTIMPRSQSTKHASACLSGETFIILCLGMNEPEANEGRLSEGERKISRIVSSTTRQGTWCAPCFVLSNDET